MPNLRRGPSAWEGVALEGDGRGPQRHPAVVNWLAVRLVRPPKAQEDLVKPRQPGGRQEAGIYTQGGQQQGGQQ